MAYAPAPPLPVSDGDRRVLAAVVRAPTSEQWAVARARIVLRSAEGGPIYGIADELGVAVMTVKLWRRYVFDGTPSQIEAPTTVIWRREDDAWKIALFHSIPLPPAS
jgi:hypothetical protein